MHSLDLSRQLHQLGQLGPMTMVVNLNEVRDQVCLASIAPLRQQALDRLVFVHKGFLPEPG